MTLRAYRFFDDDAKKDMAALLMSEHLWTVYGLAAAPSILGRDFWRNDLSTLTVAPSVVFSFPVDSSVLMERTGRSS